MKTLRRVLAAACVSFTTLVLVLAWFIDRAGVTDTSHAAEVWPDGAVAVVVLGARVEPDGTASPTLRARVEQGVRTFAASHADVLVFSGGVGRFGRSEASVARDLAVQLGVPPARTLVEEESHSTAENARFTMRLLRERYGVGQRLGVVLVSDPYHLLRARMLFERHDAVAGTSPALDAPRHRALASRVAWTLREVPATVKDALLGLALEAQQLVSQPEGGE